MQPISFSPVPDGRRGIFAQEITHFSIKLPPGVAGKLAGIPFCSDAAIAAATARTGPHGGQEELDSPSCPAASQVGRSLAGSGVGPALAYAPGKVYLAGPYHGHPVSLVAITAGVVGPFDIGTVVVRLAIDVNPETGEVFLDSTGSDPIPHIVKGIPVHLRDINVYTDRPEFTSIRPPARRPRPPPPCSVPASISPRLPTITHWSVNGHLVLPSGGHPTSPAADIFSPHWWPSVLPA